MAKKKSDLMKWIISIVWDLLVDNTIGRIPGIGTLVDIIGGFVAYKLWGPIGFISLLEIGDLSDQIDGFIPLVTTSGVLSKIKL